MAWKVPLSETNLGEEERRAADAVIRSGWLTMGPITEEFETAFADYIGVRHAFAVSSCTAALHLANMALKAGSGDEILIPGLTFVAAANTVAATGARPVLVDIESEECWNIPADNIERLITERTKAVQVVHYAGYPCDLAAIEAAASRLKLPIIEDCAHAPGAHALGRMCGTVGAFGCFSFFSNKNLTTGEGGMVVTGDDALAAEIKLLRSHGMTTLTWERNKGHASSYDVQRLGLNYRIDEIRSAIGLVQLKRLDQLNNRRRELALAYRSLLSGVEELSIPFGSADPNSSVHHIFPILLRSGSQREPLMMFLKELGIQTSIHYPLIHRFAAYSPLFPGLRLPLAESIAARELTLPLFPTMSEEQLRTVVDAIKRFFSSRAVRQMPGSHQEGSAC